MCSMAPSSSVKPGWGLQRHMGLVITPSDFLPHQRAKVTSENLTFRLLHAAGRGGWRCYRNLFSRFRMERRRKQGKGILFLSLERE